MGIWPHEKAEMVTLQSEGPPQSDRRVERCYADMLFGIEAGFHPDERGEIASMHVIDADNRGHALQMHRNRRDGVAKIKTVVGKAETQINRVFDQKPMFELY